jgi:hypothetical protein
MMRFFGFASDAVLSEVEGMTERDCFSFNGAGPEFVEGLRTAMTRKKPRFFGLPQNDKNQTKLPCCGASLSLLTARGESKLHPLQDHFN